MADTIIIETPVATVLEVSGKQGPQGVPGATGATGATGPQGPAGTGIETLTTKGDLLSRNDSGAIRVGIGSTGQVLKVASSGLPAWENESGGVPTSRTISAGTGLTGGGDLTANRTLSVSFGSSAGTVAEGNDARLSDSRTPTAHAASHAAGTKAQYTDQVAGMTENVLIRANAAGTAGNSITLAFDGVDDIDTVLSAWNSANPSNQAALISGDGSQVPDNGEEITLSGGVASGSDPFKNINQNLGTTDTPTFDGLNSTDQIAIQAAGSSGEVGVLLDNTQYGKWLLYTGAGNQDSIGIYSYGAGEDVFTFVNEEGVGRMGVANPFPQKTLDVNGVVKFNESFGLTVTDTDDATKKVSLDVSGVSPNTTRVLSVPDTTGTIALTSDIPANTIALTIVDAKGDLIVGTAADTVARLPVGATNGHVLTVDSAEASGMKWAAASGGVTSVSGTAPIVSSGGTTPVISVTTGSTAGTVCAGDDARLSDSRTPLSHTHGNITNGGLIGTTSGLPIKTGTGGIVEAGSFGTTSGTFAAGDDSRITGAAQKSANLSDLASASTARTNLGLGTAATASTGDFAAASHTHTASAISDSTTAGRALLTAADAAAQRTSLGLAAIATSGSASDLGSGTVPIARLGASGTPSGSTYLAGDNTWKSVTGGVSAMQSIAINFVLN